MHRPLLLNIGYTRLYSGDIMSELKFNVSGINSTKEEPEPQNKEYDLIIVGGGPAGFTAGIYAVRYRMKTLIIAEVSGGLAADASEVENYPGFRKITGYELMGKFKDHAVSLGAKFKQGTVVRIRKEGDKFLVADSDNNEYTAKSVILALGTKRRKLQIPGEEDFLGKGVSYCAVCDATFYKDKIVGVVGGSDAAAQAALLLSKYAKKVYIIYRRDKLRAEPVLVDRVLKDEKIEIIYNSNVIKLNGSNKLEELVLDTGQNVKADGLFIEIGGVPNTVLTKDLGVETNERGYIVVNDAMETNVKGVFAAGDVTTGSNMLEQIITACAEGALSAESAYKYCSNIASHKKMK